MPKRPTQTLLIFTLLVVIAAGLVYALTPIRAQPPAVAAPEGATVAPASPKPQQPPRESAAIREPAERIAPKPLDLKGLPLPVVDMRAAILEAVASGKLEDLRIAIELNEMRPSIAGSATGDPIAHLRSLSADGKGGDILATLGLLLQHPWGIAHLGPDIENNRIFVWPRFAEHDIRQLQGDDLAHFEALVAPQARTAMRETGAYSHWRIAIGADGTWHSLRK